MGVVWVDQDGILYNCCGWLATRGMGGWRPELDATYENWSDRFEASLGNIILVTSGEIQIWFAASCWRICLLIRVTNLC